MAWEQFSYICRKASSTLKPEESVHECLSRIEKESACQLYGDDIKPDSLARKILNESAGITDIVQIRKMFDIYGQLGLLKNLSEPIQLKRITIYLTYVTLIFFITSAIYQLKVTPVFLSAFENFDISIPNHLMFYKNYWKYFFLVMSIFLVVSLVISHMLKSLFKFKKSTKKDIFLRYLVYPSIRQSYLKIMDMLFFPVATLKQGKTLKNSQISNHLSTIEMSNMSLAKEIDILLKLELKKMMLLCEKQIQLMSFLVAVVVITAVFFFLVSAYSPIFVMGETI